MILSAAAGLLTARAAQAREHGRLFVVTSSALEPGDEYSIDSNALTIGRGGDNDLTLHGDEFRLVATRAVRTRRDGVYVEDVGSTNGTFVNGIKLTGDRRLVPGDVVRIGETDLRFEK